MTDAVVIGGLCTPLHYHISSQILYVWKIFAKVKVLLIDIACVIPSDNSDKLNESEAISELLRCKYDKWVNDSDFQKHLFQNIYGSLLMLKDYF